MIDGGGHTHVPLSIQDDLIAVVGIACRLPMTADPDAFWELLRHGTSAITEVPAGRWDPAEADSGPARYGGFVDQVDQFDPDF